MTAKYNHESFIKIDILRKVANDESIDLLRFIDKISIYRMDKQHRSFLKQSARQLDKKH